MSALDDLTTRNAQAHAPGPAEPLPAPPALQLAIVTCMDARIDVHRALGLELGEAHVIRNAGGVVTDDVLRSLAISQRRLGTTAVALIHHTRCGMEGLDEAELKAEMGVGEDYDLHGFASIEDDVRASVERVRASELLPHRDQVRGYVYDVDAGRISPVAQREGEGPAA
jgi:carbonic anhydrase